MIAKISFQNVALTARQTIDIRFLCRNRFERGGGRRGLMVMALDCGTGGCTFKPRRLQNIFDLMERFDETV